MAGMDINGLFLAYRRELQAYLTRILKDAEAAADLTQDTFLRFAELGHANAAIIVLHERPYLYRIAHNLAVDHLRRRSRERTEPVSEAVAEIPDLRPTAEHVLREQDELYKLREALRELPERTQEVFALARIEGLTYREVAKRLRISDSSVQKHLARALKHVMQRLRRD